jgi:hypothetical protein
MIDQQMTHRGIFTASRMCLFIVGHVVITSNFWFNVAQRMGKLYHENVIITGVHTLNIGDDKCVYLCVRNVRGYYYLPIFVLYVFCDMCFVGDGDHTMWQRSKSDDGSGCGPSERSTAHYHPRLGSRRSPLIRFECHHFELGL